MNPANNTQNNTSSTNNSQDNSSVDKQNVTQVQSASPGGKEHEAVSTTPKEAVQKSQREVEIPKEVEKIGVKHLKETIELPPDVKKMGVTHTGPSTPVSTTTSLPQVTLPISDQKVMKGLHEQIFSSMRWMAVWCIKKLKKAHVILKVVHGKIVRVKE